MKLNLAGTASGRSQCTPDFNLSDERVNVKRSILSEYNYQYLSPPFLLHVMRYNLLERSISHEHTSILLKLVSKHISQLKGRKESEECIRANS